LFLLTSSAFLLGTLLRVTDFTPTSLEGLLTFTGAVSPSDIPHIAAFLHRCLAIDPAARPSALELLNDPWFSDV
jgi:serine/threonine-protein kinase SRPK3